MAARRSFEICSQGVAVTREKIVDHVVSFRVGNVTIAHVSHAESQDINGTYLLEDGGRVIDTKTGSIMSNGNGTNDFEFPATA